MLIVYDFDGVVADSRESVEAMYGDLAIMCGMTLTNADMDYIFSHGMKDNVKLFGPEAWQYVHRLDYRKYADMMKLEPGVIETFSFLKGKGANIAILTSRVSGLAYSLRRFCLTGYVDICVDGKNATTGKPEPLELIFLKSLDKDIFYIGDSRIDEETADNADVPFIAYRNLELNPIYHLSCHTELIYLLTNGCLYDTR